MRMGGLLFVALLLLISGFSSSDLTASDKYAELEQQLAEIGGPLSRSQTRTQSIGVGACVPDPVVVTHLVDCRFPLAGPIEDAGVAQAVVEGLEPAFAGEGRSWPCRVEDGELVCERLVAAGVGLLSIGVDIDGSLAGSRASLTVLPYTLPAEIWIEGQESGAAQVQVVAADVPVEIEARRRAALGPVWLLVRSWPGLSQLVSPQLLADAAMVATVELTLNEPGQYELVLCNGLQPETCIADASGRRLQVIEPTVEELIPGHNLPGGDRVNLVVTGGGWESVDRLAEVAQVLFDPSAEPMVSPDGSGLWWPPFTIEPLASNGHLFNLWLLPDQIDLLVQGADQESGVSAAFDMEDSSFLHLQADPVRLGGWAELPSFWQSVNAPGPSDEVILGSAVVFVDPAEPFAAAQGVSHELGHSLFGLIDEYQRDEPAPKLAPPNCAENQAQAEQWWGDLVGEVDPQFQIYRSALQEHGLWTDDMEATLEDDLTVGFFNGWCLAATPDAVVPIRLSLMSDDVPVFGAVNRRQVELVLQRWAGTAPLATEHLLDALSADCITTEITTACQLSVAPLLIEPSESLHIRIGGDPAECSFPSVTSQEPALVSCPAVSRQSDTLEASVNSGPWVKLADLTPLEETETNEPPPGTTPTTVAGEEAAPSNDSGNGPTGAIWVALVALVAAATTITAMKIRRRNRPNKNRTRLTIW